MSIYRLNFKTATGTTVPLPSDIDRNTEIERLQEFAREHGYGPEAWEADNQPASVKKLFKYVSLEPANDITQPLKNVKWTPFKKALREEDSLFEFPWPVFERRIKGGLLSAIVDDNNQTIATTNVIAKLNAALYETLGLKEAANGENPPQVYETGAGWVDERYRGLGIYTQLRQLKLNEAQAKGRLLFSEAKGKGASFVNIKDGYTLVNWNDYPFAAALMGWLPSEEQIEQDPSLEGQFVLAAGKRINLPEKRLYNGGTIVTATPKGTRINPDFIATHEWHAYHHLWVNDLDKLHLFEQNIREELGVAQQDPTSEVFQYALQRWKKSVAEALFNDKALLGTNPKLEERWAEFKDPITPKDPANV